VMRFLIAAAVALTLQSAPTFADTGVEGSSPQDGEKVVYVLIVKTSNVTLGTTQRPQIVGVYTSAARCLYIGSMPPPPGYHSEFDCRRVGFVETP
jgi:hypothetical protein